jgi:cbb3-type cytochrome oxidase subunit 3
MSVLAIIIYALVGLWALELVTIATVVAHFERSRKQESDEAAREPVDSARDEASSPGSTPASA